MKGFTNDTIAYWAQFNLILGTAVLSDGLACFGAVTEAGCTHLIEIVGKQNSHGLPFEWVNIVLGNLKTMFSDDY